ncbi:MAG: hypothetical protein ACRERC_04290 [Candidatus Binatia bacterium]
MGSHIYAITVAIGALFISGPGLLDPAQAACYPIGYASCPSGATQYCTANPHDPTSSAEAQLACDTCYGTSCYLETADCAGPGWGPNPPGSYVCGDAYFGYTAGCSGAAGRVWYICSSYTTYGFWGGPSTCFNSVQDGGETGVDCGGPDCAACLVCGNGAVQMGEQCDDGNTVNGDCCDSSCQYEAFNSPCPADSDVCTDDVCDGAGACGVFNTAPCDDLDACTTSDACDSAGTCVGGPPPNCNDSNACSQDSCNSGSGCVNAFTPVGSCKVAGKSILLLKNNTSDDGKDKLIWKWLKGANTTLPELGTPTGATAYTLCLYAGTASAAVAIPAGPPSWQVLGSKGFKFKSATGLPDGAQKVVLKSGATGKAKALVKGKGTDLPDSLVPALPLPVTAQLVNDANSTCFEAVYAPASVLKNDARQFKAKN